MKGGGRGMEPPVEGEVSGKRPKRKCLQWHPLLSKKALDFSEEEEEEDEEELDKGFLVEEQTTYMRFEWEKNLTEKRIRGLESLLCRETVGPEAECGATEEDEGEEDSSEQRARRPMNAFLLFCKRHRSLVRQEHPRLDNRGATKILADWWAVLEPPEKQKYTDMAKEYKDAFMKANPGYKWCPTTNKPVKSPSPPMASSRRKVWSFSSGTPKDCAITKKATKEESPPQLHFGMADPTKMGGLSMLLLAGEHALSTSREIISSTSPPATDSPQQSRKSPLLQLAEISSASSQSGATAVAKQPDKSTPFQLAEISSSDQQSEVKTPTSDVPEITEGTLEHEEPRSPTSCVTSPLFQLAEMCLASEVGSMEPWAVQPARDSLTVTSSKEPACNSQEASDLTLSSPCSSSYSSSASSTPIESCPPTFDQPETRKKKKKKKKKAKGEAMKFVSDTDTPKKLCKKRQSSESDIESVIYTIEAVAKGAWTAEKTPKKKVLYSIEDSVLPKKKVKPKLKKPPKAKYEEGQAKDFKPMEQEESPQLSVRMEENQSSAKEEPLLVKEEGPPSQPPPPPSPPALPIKTEEKEAEAKPESCGSRKSERTCKGALYKTLVSEGMLTSLRANVDRGKRGSCRGSISDHEGSWPDDSWVFAQTGGSSAKKLKKSKSRDDSLTGLGKLEEEFEKKFNSLPQYSPLTFDRKSTSVTKKKKATPAPSEQPNLSKGSSSSQKKNLFHKIVSKYKHKKEKSSTMDKAIAMPESCVQNTTQVKPTALCSVLYPDTLGAAEMLVGSQKRKARKSKITHLVRTAEGRVSPAEEDKAQEASQDQEEKPLSQETLCNEAACFSDRKSQETHADSTEGSAMSDLPSFFSLAALAEVAAMENAHRSQRMVSMPSEGQSKDMGQTAVLISCADQ